MTQSKKRFKIWTLSLMTILALAFLVSCEEDYNLTGSEIVGEDSMISDPDVSSTVVAYSKQLKGIRTNISEANKTGMLGIYNDPVFGKTTVNFLSQLHLSRVNPAFGDQARIDSVKLHLPYYVTSKIESDTTYVIDSLYSRREMKIEVYESNYFLREMDPNTNFEESQAYYSDQAAVFESQLGEKIGEFDNYLPRPVAIVHATGLEEDEEKEIEKWQPGVYFDLSKEYFEAKILDKQGEPELVSNESFVEYFRGLYFKVSSDNNSGSLPLFKIDESKIRVYYSSEPKEEDGQRLTGTLDLSFENGTKVQTIEKEHSAYVQQQLVEQDTLVGSSRLLAQGGESIVSIIKLFGEDSNDSGVPDELEQLRIDRPIVNEANLVLHVDQDAMQDIENEPERIIIFNAENGKVLTDYVIDQTASANTLSSKIIHLGRLERDEKGRGISYKLRITNFISDLINNDMKNVPLGIAIIPNVEKAEQVNVNKEQNTPVGGVPSGSLYSPRGTVFHGPMSENQEKRLQLELYLTEVK